MNIAQKPAISVVMAVFNGGIYLSQAIESILQQSWRDFEFIIINDGSTDQTAAIIDEYAREDSRIKIISRENRGLVASLNEGVAEAKSDLIARMDADDISHPNRFLEQINYLREHPLVVCVGSYYEVIDEDGDLLTTLNAPTKNESIQQALIKGHTVICHPTAIYRKDAFEKAGGYDNKFFLVEDLDLWLKLGELGELANIPIPLVKYRTNINSVSTQAGIEQMNRAAEVIKIASARRKVQYDFQLKEHWRPNPTPASKYSFMLKYGWWAFKSHNRLAAIKYAKKAIKLMPWRVDGWRLLISSMLKLKAAV